MTRLRWAALMIPMIVQLSFSQPPDVSWTRIYGGDQSDQCSDVGVTSDGGFIFAGESASFNFDNYDAYVVRTNANGDTLWTRTYGGGGNDGASSIRPTTDGGWIIAGSTESSGAGHNDFWLVKIDSMGNQQWQHTYGAAGYDYGTAGEQTADGGYVIAGFSKTTIFANPDARLIKTNSSGVQQWSRTFGVSGNQEVFYDVHELSDHRFVMCGYNDSFTGNGGWDAWVQITDSLGQNPTSRLFGGFGQEAAYSIVPVSDGFVFCGYTDRDASIAEDYYLVRLNTLLDTLWTRNYGRPYVDEAFDLIQTSDGGFLMTGQTCIPQSDECAYDMYLVRTDRNGDTLWTKQIGDVHSDAAFASRELADGGFIVAGYNTSPDILDYDFFVARLAGGCPDLTPRAPQGLTAYRIGNDMRLLWHPVTTSTANCPVTVSAYHILSDVDVGGSFPTLTGSTADTVFIDVGGALSNPHKFYEVSAVAP